MVFFFKLEERDLMVFMGGGKQPVGRDRLTAAQVGKGGLPVPFISDKLGARDDLLLPLTLTLLTYKVQYTE